MIYRTLGRSGLEVSIMGMGTGGAEDPLGQASGRPEAEAHRLLHRAFELGVNLFDTSPGYMDSELILGRVLKSLPRDQLIVSTKVSLGDESGIKQPAEIVTSVENSLKRLQMVHVDLLLIAVSGGVKHFEVVMNEHLPILCKLKDQGKIRFLGSSEHSSCDGEHLWLQKVLPTNIFDVAMVAHNMINQSAQKSIFPLCKELNLGVINVFTVRRALGLPHRTKEVISDLLKLGVISPTDVAPRNPFDWLLHDGEVGSVIEAAYRYAAYTEPVTTVMNGANRISWLEENIANVLKGPLSPEITERLGNIFGRVKVPIGN